MKPLTGVVHGNRIDLDGDLGLPDGQEVEVLVRPKRFREAVGGGLQRCAGAMTSLWTDDDDRILEEIQRDREQAEMREPVE
jgi:hypothetical protein